MALSEDASAAFVAGSGVWEFAAGDSGWLQQGGSIGETHVATSVAVSGDGGTVAIGAPLENDRAGEVRLHTRRGDGWTEIARLHGDVAGGWLGSTLALTSDARTLVAGGLAGAVPFSRAGAGWDRGKTVADPGGEGSSSGTFPTGIAISADGNTLALGDTDGQHLSGVILTREEDQWVRVSMIQPRGDLDRVGDIALAASGETAVVDGTVLTTGEVGP
ncbi:hypothetical protein LRS13_12710 [Svornostia abyssi]|uniref:Uncharacterized protein n=1 Tax=Svornostia abyssi TaxID=2898438 RepID=A0ABY5PA92_9ACTN|nr:hypothetical protein LRS13_12710 [Parviterribacteraceae bacterium J379]